MFAGRQDELRTLEKRYASKSGELVVIYGRRRIGKTELIRQFCQNKPHVFYIGRESSAFEQLRVFSSIIQPNSVFSDWETALRLGLGLSATVNDTGKIEKHILVLDEFPYMAKSVRTLPSILQLLWDSQLQKANIMLIICGSSLSFMENDVLGIQSPLYGRATCIIKLNELAYRECRLFSPDDTPRQAIEKWALLGGIPHYQLQFEAGLSLEQNILEHVLDKSCPLSSEIDFILRQELRDSSNYNSVIQAIAFGATRISEISARTGILANNLSTYLKNLLEIGIIEKEHSLCSTDGEKANVHRAFYRIQDNFMKFYFRFMYPNYTELELGNTKSVFDNIVLPEYDHFVSSVFERLCRQYLRYQNGLPESGIRFTSIGRCFQKNIEVDMIAFLVKQPVVAGECKWSGARVGLPVLRSLQTKCNQLHLYSNDLIYCLFSKSGFDNELVALAKSDPHLRLISPEDLYT